MSLEITTSHRYTLKGYKLRQQLASLLVIGDTRDHSEFEVTAELALKDGDFIHQLRGEDIFSVADVYAMDQVRDALQECLRLKKKDASTLDDDE